MGHFLCDTQLMSSPFLVHPEINKAHLNCLKYMHLHMEVGKVFSNYYKYLHENWTMSKLYPFLKNLIGKMGT